MATAARTTSACGFRAPECSPPLAAMVGGGLKISGGTGEKSLAPGHERPLRRTRRPRRQGARSCRRLAASGRHVAGRRLRHHPARVNHYISELYDEPCERRAVGVVQVLCLAGAVSVDTVLHAVRTYFGFLKLPKAGKTLPKVGRSQDDRNDLHPIEIRDL